MPTVLIRQSIVPKVWAVVSQKLRTRDLICNINRVAVDRCPCLSALFNSVREFVSADVTKG